jgi:hypothetical protein
MSIHIHQGRNSTQDLVVGAVANSSWKVIKPWVVSLERSGYAGKKVVVAYDLTPDVIERLIARDFYIKHVGRLDRWIHVDRFFFLWQLLHEMEARYVIATDTRDLIFQTDPSTWLEEHLSPFRLNVGSECIAYKDEPAGNQNVLGVFGPDVHDRMKEKTIFNAGSFAGEASVVRDLCLNIYLICYQNSDNQPDQAALNVLINLSPWKEITRFSSMGDGWACQAGTVANPAKMNSFRPFLKEPEPVFGPDGLVYPAGSATPFCIVHQYDRNPAWRSPIRSKYSD